MTLLGFGVILGAPFGNKHQLQLYPVGGPRPVARIIRQRHAPSFPPVDLSQIYLKPRYYKNPFLLRFLSIPFYPNKKSKVLDNTFTYEDLFPFQHTYQSLQPRPFSYEHVESKPAVESSSEPENVILLQDSQDATPREAQQLDIELLPTLDASHLKQDNLHEIVPEVNNDIEDEYGQDRRDQDIETLQIMEQQHAVPSVVHMEEQREQSPSVGHVEERQDIFPSIVQIQEQRRTSPSLGQVEERQDIPPPIVQIEERKPASSSVVHIEERQHISPSVVQLGSHTYRINDDSQLLPPVIVENEELHRGLETNGYNEIRVARRDDLFDDSMHRKYSEYYWRGQPSQHANAYVYVKMYHGNNLK